MGKSARPAAAGRLAGRHLRSERPDPSGRDKRPPTRRTRMAMARCTGQPGVPRLVQIRELHRLEHWRCFPRARPFAPGDFLLHLRQHRFSGRPGPQARRPDRRTRLRRLDHLLPETLVWADRPLPGVHPPDPDAPFWPDHLAKCPDRPCDLQHWFVQEDGHRRHPGGLRQPAIRRQPRREGLRPDHRLDGGCWLHVSVVLRLFRLFRHGHWRGADIRGEAADQLSFAAPRRLGRRLLAALAHDAAKTDRLPGV